MPPLPKCLLLPIDGSEEALRPLEFLKRLYPDRGQLSILLSYSPLPLPPAYQGKLNSPELLKMKQQLLVSREQKTRSVVEQAKKTLIREGFSSNMIEAHVQERQLSTAKDACLLADRKKVDAVLVQKRFTANLESLLANDPTNGLLHHCQVSPVWLTDGAIDVSRAAICITSERASLRAADHAAFMLSGTDVRVTLLHVARTISHPATSPATVISADLEKWLITPEGRQVKPFFVEAHDLLQREGIDDERVEITVLPSHGKVASEILSYCREAGIGIVVLGHSPPTGIKGFFQGSVTKKILADLKNMSVWVNQ
jgi:nucleotide-binding universal stress UspA family protein